MLRVWFGKKESAIYNTSMFFENSYIDEWLLDKEAKEMIKDIDNSIVKSANSIISPVLGNISPDKLSGGVKTLLLIKNEPNKIFNASNCGDNCAKWILKLAKSKDITINLYHVMDFGNEEFEIKILNGSPRIVKNMADFILLADKYL